MTKNAKIKKISGTLRLAALELNKQPEAKDKLLKIAGALDALYSPAPMGGGSPNLQLLQGDEQPVDATPAQPDLQLLQGDQQPAETKPKSRFGLDQEQQRYYKVNVEFLYIPAADNLQARDKVTQALSSIAEFKNKFNVGEAQGQSVKEPS